MWHSLDASVKSLVRRVCSNCTCTMGLELLAELYSASGGAAAVRAVSYMQIHHDHMTRAGRGGATPDKTQQGTRLSSAPHQ